MSFLKGQLELIFKVMRTSQVCWATALGTVTFQKTLSLQVLANSMLKADEFNAIVGNLSYMKYGLRISLPVEDNATSELNHRGKPIAKQQWEKDSAQLDMIMDCQMPSKKGGKVFCGHLFHHTPTSKGVCSTVNAASLLDVMRNDLDWLQKFKK